MSDAYPATQAEPGRFGALAAYGLYILSIPSAALFAPLGLIVAYASRAGAGPVALSHLNDQIRIFWIAFIWGVGLAIAFAVSWVLVFVLIGIPMLWVVGLLGLGVMLWFTIKSVLGLLRLLDGRPV